MEYQIHLPVFEGPFDLLLHLIRENQVNIYDIPIAEITDQYLGYLEMMEELDLEIASSFLVLAANLLSIKARMLLPVQNGDEEEEDVRSELVHDLLEYIRFKEAAASLDKQHQASSRFIMRPNEQELYLNLFSEENPLAGKTLLDLQFAFGQVLRKAGEKVDQSLHVQREQITVKDKINELLLLVAAEKSGLAFSLVFSNCRDKYEMVVTFLALLELVRRQRVVVNQSSNFGEIFLYPGEREKNERTSAS